MASKAVRERLKGMAPKTTRQPTPEKQKLSKSEKKCRRQEQKREYARALVYLGQEFPRWQKLKDEMGLPKARKGDACLAAILMNVYEATKHLVPTLGLGGGGGPALGPCGMTNGHTSHVLHSRVPYRAEGMFQYDGGECGNADQEEATSEENDDVDEQPVGFIKKEPSDPDVSDSVWTSSSVVTHSRFTPDPPVKQDNAGHKDNETSERSVNVEMPNIKVEPAESEASTGWPTRTVATTRRASPPGTTDDSHRCYSCGAQLVPFDLMAEVQVRGKKPHQCQECGSSFASLSNLTHHMIMRSHTGCEQFRCVQCGGLFLPLVSHSPSHSQPSSVGPLSHPPDVGPTSHPPHVGPASHPPHVGPTSHPPHVGPASHPPHVVPTSHPPHAGPLSVSHPPHARPPSHPPLVGPTSHPPCVRPVSHSPDLDLLPVSRKVRRIADQRDVARSAPLTHPGNHSHHVVLQPSSDDRVVMRWFVDPSTRPPVGVGNKKTDAKTKDSVREKTDGVTVKTEDDVTVKTEDDVTVKTEDDVTVKTEDDVTVKTR